MIYWLLLIFCIILSLTCKKSLQISVNRIISSYEIYICIIALVLVILASLRGGDVGKDTLMYKQLFEYAKESVSLQELSDSWKSGYVEKGYLFLEYFLSRYFDFQMLLGIAACVAIIPTLVVIYKYSMNYFYSLFLYISFGYFSFAMNGIRQAIAMGICMIAYIMAKEKKLVKFILLVAVAFLFHKSAIVFLPVYWVIKIRPNLKIQLAYIVLLLGVFALRYPIYQVLNMFSRQEYEVLADSGGTRMFLFMVAAILIVLIYWKGSSDEEWIDRFKEIHMLEIAILIWPVASLNTNVFRLYYYFHIFIILCIPNFLKSLKDRRAKFLLYILFTVIGMYYLNNYVINSELKYAPYYFFWE